MSRPSAWRLQSRRLVKEHDLQEWGADALQSAQGGRRCTPGPPQRREAQQLRLGSLSQPGFEGREGSRAEVGTGQGVASQARTARTARPGRCQAASGRIEKASQAAAGLCVPYPQNKDTHAASSKRGPGDTSASLSRFTFCRDPSPSGPGRKASGGGRPAAQPLPHRRPGGAAGEGEKVGMVDVEEDTQGGSLAQLADHPV